MKIIVVFFFFFIFIFPHLLFSWSTSPSAPSHFPRIPSLPLACSPSFSAPYKPSLTPLSLPRVLLNSFTLFLAFKIPLFSPSPSPSPPPILPSHFPAFTHFSLPPSRPPFLHTPSDLYKIPLSFTLHRCHTLSSRSLTPSLLLLPFLAYFTLLHSFHTFSLPVLSTFPRSLRPCGA